MSTGKTFCASSLVGIRVHFLSFFFSGFFFSLFLFQFFPFSVFSLFSLFFFQSRFFQCFLFSIFSLCSSAFLVFVLSLYSCWSQIVSMSQVTGITLHLSVHIVWSKGCWPSHWLSQWLTESKGGRLSNVICWIKCKQWMKPNAPPPQVNAHWWMHQATQYKEWPAPSRFH